MLEMLESHAKASHLIYSAMTILQQKSEKLANYGLLMLESMAAYSLKLFGVLK